MVNVLTRAKVSILNSFPNGISEYIFIRALRLETVFSSQLFQTLEIQESYIKFIRFAASVYTGG